MKLNVLALLIVMSFISACVNKNERMLMGKWEYENAEIKITTKNDTSQKVRMDNFVTQLIMQTTDFIFEEGGKFRTLEKGVESEKGKFTVSKKILTLEYGEGKNKEYEDYELINLSDSILQIRNANNLVIKYKKVKPGNKK